MVTTPNRKVLLAVTAMLVMSATIASALGAMPGGKMSSEKLGRNLCETSGGAKIVPIPGFPGERIDQRLLDDVRMLQRRYKIFVTDGYSNDPVHSANGEHPMALALDIVPDKAAGGSWRDITALAKWAEPQQNAPVAPFRWVGYDGDSGHGRGHHLHLSWNHSETPAGTSPKTVYTLRCPGGKTPPVGAPATPTPTPTGGGKKPNGGDGPKGGLEPGKGGKIGGLNARRGLPVDPSAPVAETGGAGLR